MANSIPISSAVFLRVTVLFLVLVQRLLLLCLLEVSAGRGRQKKRAAAPKLVVNLRAAKMDSKRRPCFCPIRLRQALLRRSAKSIVGPFPLASKLASVLPSRSDRDAPVRESGPSKREKEALSRTSCCSTAGSSRLGDYRRHEPSQHFTRVAFCRPSTNDILEREKITISPWGSTIPCDPVVRAGTGGVLDGWKGYFFFGDSGFIVCWVLHLFVFDASSRVDPVWCAGPGGASHDDD